MEGKQWLEELRKRWVIFSFGKVLVLSLASALIIAALLFHFFQWGIIGFVVPFIVVFSFLSLRSKYWEISITAASRFADLHFPEVEESSGLLLKPAETLSFLEQLQLQKVNRVLPLQKQPAGPLQQMKVPLIFLLAGAAISFFVFKLPHTYFSPAPETALTINTGTKVKEVIPLQISSFKVEITPPSYTGKPTRTQKQFTILAETGSSVKWEIHTSQPLGKLSLLLNDNESLSLKPLNAEKTSWTLAKVMLIPGFYQVVLDGKKSDFYQIEIISDQPVAIKITRPAQHSTIDVGQPQQLNLGVLLNDDYGISDAYLSATMASGKGEAVSFKEKKIAFNIAFNHQKQVKLDKLIPLKELGMKPGDELYFYVNATDNHGQQSRSDMYILSIQDTTELMSLTGIDNGVNLVPEYFRSERQLIMDTEKLLKEKSTLTETEFKNRSNDLGIDQKMLRLRYGKFLGEETEANIGGGHEDPKSEFAEHGHDDHAEGAKFGDMQSTMEQYAHKHDNAEDATFFEPQLKAQLKATLTEMWKAELQLRTYFPQEALPFEYKALRLLKDLQQKSRAYVAKTTFKTSPLKMEKRLTGELTDIKIITTKSDFSGDGNSQVKMEQAIGLLERMKDGQSRTPAEMSLLLAGEKQLMDGAAIAPGAYLPGLKAIKKIIGAGQSGKVNSVDLALAEKGMNALLGKKEVSPASETAHSSSALSRSYFNQLKRSMP
ncbi:DUF4175 family protein [Pedobacter sp. L105]|uniref:DUF4175 family protein n=1 Tax=Pedobacter sp. L105 TaxID=1641871 RepID=UPI00131B0ADC|nr:DUF4175 family protein [Pedobacter sp. L105]